MFEIPVSKVCTKCGVDKPLSEFSRSKHCKFGRRAECKECAKKRTIVLVPTVSAKRCSKCGIRKDSSFFSLSKNSKDGLQSWCRSCHREKRQDPETKASFIVYKKEWRANRTPEQKQADSDKYSIYYDKNREIIIAKSVRINKRKYNSDPQSKLRRLLGVRVKDVLKGKAKAGSAVQDLGCSPFELVTYLESRFLPGMTWGNHGIGRNNQTWHVDHAVPLSAFDLTDRQHFLLACNYLNLQPMWGSDNIRKGGAKRAA